jgi:acetyl esterase/lipase
MAVAEQDLLAPEALAFGAQLRGLGVDVEITEYKGMTHTILAMNGESHQLPWKENQKLTPRSERNICQRQTAGDRLWKGFEGCFKCV